MEYILPDLNLLKVEKNVSSDGKSGQFVIEPLSPGYGVTVGNSIRRILLSSLEGAAVKSVKIKGVEHEFSPIKGLKEDAVDLILNLKTARFALNGDGPATISLSVKGPKKITCADFKKNSDLEPIDPDHYLATIDKGSQLEIDVEVDKGRGYLPVEKRTDSNAPVGTIMVDSIYTPVKKVKYEVENTRVGSVTNYDKLVFDITTDGSISASQALNTATKIMAEHLSVIIDATAVGDVEAKPKSAKKKATKKAKADESHEDILEG
ncbi:MAG: DNA-directed RNA polymerase subunit alpha [candidate division WS2 bacterium ADurb.Bin280]|uniref:DNA-directed RNA polymerase subunit alpha n=1 Tax=candidate division WS2 bacterium ADurb.Bin280 TaxID=1852829 RepID=A0A1V5SD63_9BACT|nr:MAG: DNA-directed RNA polymerase subunit alpha [candidate division WS2 bacterium ADurb.Bin280]